MPDLLVIQRNMPTYGDFPGEVGRVVPRMRLRNDPILEKRGYIQTFEGRTEDLVPCEQCGALFLSYHQRDAHVVKTKHSPQDGHVVSHTDPNLSRTPEMEAQIKTPRPLEEVEPGGFKAQIGEVDTYGRTVPAEYSSSAEVRATAKRGRPRKRP